MKFLATVLALPIFGRLRALKEPADRITADVSEGKAPPVAAFGTGVEIPPDA